jgi:hypothetical protein
MSVSWYVEHEDGKIWAVGDNVVFSPSWDKPKPSSGCIIIPIDQIEGLTNEEIGKRVKEFLPEARIAYISQLIEYFNFNDLECCNYVELKNGKEELKDFLKEIFGGSQLIYDLEGDKKAKDFKFQVEDLIERINFELEKRILKKVGEKTKKDKRKFINKNRKLIYDNLVERDGERCRDCKNMGRLHIDHIIPLDYNGSNDLKNLQLLCQSCNLKKSNKIPAD